ncbi:MAG: pyrroline-5-carboxylate reductase dimerization domain-containing protein, partial [Alphaproteobacteria bacterium]
AIGKGITVAVPNALTKENDVANAHALLMAGGDVEWLDDEDLMDAVTALSGSGPAYIFHLIEILARTGEKLGLETELAIKLARQTVIGSAALAESEPDIPAAQLRENVTSPGGTTEAALKVLMDGRLENIFEEALKAAHKRGQDLNSSL